MSEEIKEGFIDACTGDFLTLEQAEGREEDLIRFFGQDMGGRIVLNILFDIDQLKRIQITHPRVLHMVREFVIVQLNRITEMDDDAEIAALLDDIYDICKNVALHMVDEGVKH